MTGYNNCSKTVFTRLDNRHSDFLETLNLVGENLVCIAGNAGIGKTTLALEIALNYAQKSSKSVYIFSLEMLAKQIYDRLILLLSGSDLYITKTEADRSDFAEKQLSRMNIIVDDTVILTVSQIEERMKKIDSPGLVIVDCFQLLQADKEANERHFECYEIGGQLKNLSKSLSIPIILTSCLPRSIELRKDKRPCLTDLEGIGVFEKDMDTVCLLYRDVCYDPLKDHNRVEIIIPKNKCGSLCTIILE